MIRTRQITPAQGMFAGGAYVERWQVSRHGGLAGQSVEIDGIAGSVTDVIVRIEHLDGTSQMEHLLPQKPRFTVQGPTSTLQIAGS